MGSPLPPNRPLEPGEMSTASGFVHPPATVPAAHHDYKKQRCPFLRTIMTLSAIIVLCKTTP